ncbi:MAG: VanZ family protein [Desulfobacterales bacterium]|nr:MAG: VanZ family protein [Desulfobacterales bacterium]
MEIVAEAQAGQNLKMRRVLVIYVSLVILLSLLPTPSRGPSLGYLSEAFHFFAYSGMAVLALLSFGSKKAGFVALLSAVGLGALLEWGQSYVPGREMSLTDGITNTLGVLSGALFFRFHGHVLINWLRSYLE